MPQTTHAGCVFAHSMALTLTASTMIPIFSKDLHRLPPWFRVAFAVRCGKRSMEFVRDELHALSASRLAAVCDQGIQFAGNAAADANFPDRYRDLASIRLQIQSDYNAAKNRALTAKNAAFIEAVGSLAIAVVDSAMAVTRSVPVDDKDRDNSSSDKVYRTLALNEHLAKHSSESWERRLTCIAAASQFDYQLLVKLSASLEAPLTAACSANALGPLWMLPKELEFERPATTECHKTLLLKVEVPIDADNADVERVVAEAAARANALHMAFGGHGLQIDDVVCPIEVGSLEGAY